MIVIQASYRDGSIHFSFQGRGVYI